MNENVIICEYKGPNDLCGAVIGEWSVIGYAGDKSWWCRCSCGCIRKIKAWSLINGKTMSCGHTKRNDLVGKQIGEWSVLEYKGGSKYLCRCSCGKEKEVSAYSLTSGQSKSCGHSTSSLIDETGNIYGELEVLKYIGNQSWRCKCSCGKEIDVSGKRLRNGLTKSCGHDKRVDITGKQLGQWTVIKYAGDLRWKCKCSCGVVRDVLGEALRNGSSKSCGCGGKDVKENYRLKMLGRFGEVSVSRLDNPREKWQLDALSSSENLKRYIIREFNGNKPSATELAEKLDTSFSRVVKTIHKYKLEQYIDFHSSVSKKEKDIAEFISSVYNGDIELNSRNTIKPYELDIYLPDKRLAIEFNGNYWHSEMQRDKYYHINKTRMCIENGIRLIHIFEYEWDNANDKIKDFLYRLVSNKNIVYARELDIKYIENGECSLFLEKYHLQGNINASVQIGAFYNKELVGVVTFGYPRFNKEYQYELLRIAWKSNIAAVGGAERMLNKFLKDYKPDSIISYCNLAKFDGNVYNKMGFNKVGVSEPGYVWTNSIEVVPRYRAQKQKLIDKGLGTAEESESDIMHKLGYYRVYDCGNIVFEWRANNV